MLDGLDDIDWRALTHAGGEASDVPDQLRAVATGGDEADDAVYALCGNIYHQGTVYPATAYAVPFVAELARRPIQERVNLVVLLAEIAAARSGPDAARAAVLAHAGSVLAGLATERDREMQAALIGLAAVIGPSARSVEAALLKLGKGKSLLAAGSRLAWHRVRGEAVPNAVLAVLAAADEEIADLVGELPDDGPAPEALVASLLPGFAGRLADAAG